MTTDRPRCTATHAVTGEQCKVVARPGEDVCTFHSKAPNERKCTATKRNGEPCGNWALKGLNVCKFHGGAPKHVREAGARRAAAQEAMAKLAKRQGLFAEKVTDADPGRQLLELIQWTAGEVMFWREEVRELGDVNPGGLVWGRTKQTPLGTEFAAGLPVAYQALHAAQDRLAQYCSLALKAGVEERRVRLAEKQGDIVVAVITRILDALNLTPEQQAQVPEVVPRELRLVTA